MKSKVHAVCLWTLLACIGCTGSGSLMPTSGGRPYEVVVVGADADAVNIVADGLKACTMQGLPQPEPSFDVSAVVADGLNQVTRYARNVVLVSMNDDTLRKPAVTYALNPYAQPQLVLQLQARDASQLRLYNKYYVRAIERQLLLHEQSQAVVSLRENHNTTAEALIDSMFGARLWVPEDLQKWKKSCDFLWLSDDAAQGMRNICIYRYKDTTLSKQEAIRKRDSVMRANLPGESAGSYMTTVANTVEETRPLANGKSDNTCLLELHGLWAMEGEAMGGPFISRTVKTGDSLLVCEAFVYSPGHKKRNQLRRLEACLHTLAVNKEN